MNEGAVGRLRRLAPLLLVGGALLAGSQVLPRLPHERRFDLRLDEPRTVTSVEMTWGEDGEPVKGTSWTFAPGSAPTRLEGMVSLPDGRYEIDIVVRRDAAEATQRRSITLGDAQHVTIRLAAAR